MIENESAQPEHQGFIGRATAAFRDGIQDLISAFSSKKEDPVLQWSPADEAAYLKQIAERNPEYFPEPIRTINRPEWQMIDDGHTEHLFTLGQHEETKKFYYKSEYSVGGGDGSLVPWVGPFENRALAQSAYVEEDRPRMVSINEWAIEREESAIRTASAKQVLPHASSFGVELKVQPIKDYWAKMVVSGGKEPEISSALDEALNRGRTM